VARAARSRVAEPYGEMLLEAGGQRGGRKVPGSIRWGQLPRDGKEQEARRRAGYSACLGVSTMAKSVRTRSWNGA